MNENVNPDNVNPHFDRPEEFGLYPPVSTKVEMTAHSGPGIETNNLQHLGPIQVLTDHPVQPCPSCGHCPTCGRGPSWPVYRGPWWGYDPGFTFIPCTTSGGEGATVKFGPIS